MVEQPMETAADPELPPIDETILRQLVHQKLQELRHGDLFMDGLGEECYPTLLTNEKYYDVFTNILGAAWMNIHLGINVEHGLNGGKMKRKRKKFVRAIRQAREFIRPEIEHYKSLKHTPNIVRTNERNRDETKTDTFSSKVKETPPHEIGDTVDSNRMDDVSSINSHNSHSTSRYSKSSAKRKKKKSKKVKKKSRKDKRKYNKKGKARKKRSKYKDSDDDDSRIGSALYNGAYNAEVDSDGDELVPVHYTKAQAKEEFERTKAKILKEIPKEVSDQFRTLGFCKWSKEWLPCLQLSPYDVSPGQVRDSWMEMFHNCKISGRPMTRLIFWYGTATDSMSDAYSFLPEKNLLSYEEGCLKGYNQIPPKIAKKLATNKKFTKNEEQHMRGLEEIKAEEKRKPEDRIGWLEEWQEDYELITDKEDIDATDDDSLSINSSPTTAKKRGGKRKLNSDDDDNENEGKHRKKSKTSKIQHNLLKQKDGEIKMKKKKKSKKKAGYEVITESKVKGSESKKMKETSVDDISIKLEDSDENSSEIKNLGSKKKGKKRDKSDNGFNRGIKVKPDHEEVTEKYNFSDDDKHDSPNVDATLSENNSDYELSDDAQKDKALTKSNNNNTHDQTNENDRDDHEETLRKEKRLKDFYRRERLRKEKCEREGVLFEPREYKPKGRKKKPDTTKISNEIKECDVNEKKSSSECEQIFKPLMQDLDKANSTVNASLAMDTLQNILKSVEKITPQFVRETKIGLLIKKTRKKIGSSHTGIERKCREVTAELKRVFSAKEKSASLSSNPNPPKVLVKQDLRDDSKIKKEKVEESDDVNGTENFKNVESENIMTEIKIKQEEISEDTETKNVGDITYDSSTKLVVKEEQLTQAIDVSVIKKDRTTTDQSVNIEMAESPRPEKSRPSNRGFSLRGMFEKPKKATILKENTDRSVNLSPTRNRIPAWLTDSTQTSTFPQENSGRNLGLEVLSEAISVFPGDAVINKASVARVIEAAVFKWANSSWNQRGTAYSKSSMKAYWEKIDDVVAAISGRTKEGTIVQRILDGDFSTADDFIKLPRKTLYLSFMEKII